MFAVADVSGYLFRCGRTSVRPSLGRGVRALRSAPCNSDRLLHHCLGRGPRPPRMTEAIEQIRAARQALRDPECSSGGMARTSVDDRPRVARRRRAGLTGCGHRKGAAMVPHWTDRTLGIPPWDYIAPILSALASLPASGGIGSIWLMTPSTLTSVDLVIRLSHLHKRRLPSRTDASFIRSSQGPRRRLRTAPGRHSAFGWCVHPVTARPGPP
jgi:hypothetical protein